MKILAVIVNHNSAALAAAACASLRACRDDGADILVVDNSLNAEERSRLEHLLPEERKIFLDSNDGYGAACNHGIAIAEVEEYDVTFILNPDVVVAPDFLKILRRRHRGETTVLCPAICSDPAMTELEGIGSTIDLATGRHRLVGAGLHPDYVNAPANDEMLPLGTAMWVPTAIWKKAGRFDETLFAYFEDADFGLRARALGIDFQPVFEARLFHYGAASFGGKTSPDRIYYAVRNHLEIVRRHGRGDGLLQPPARWRIIALNALYFMLSGVFDRAAAKAFGQAVRDFKAGGLGRRNIS